MATKDELLAEAKTNGVEVPEGATKAEVQELLDNHQETTAEETPAERVAKDIEKSGIQGVSVGSTVNESDDPEAPDAKSDGSNREDQTVAPQANGIDGVERDHTPAGTTDEANSGDAVERLQPPVAANGLSAEATDEAYVANTQVNPALTAAEVKDGENQGNLDVVAARKAEMKEVDSELGSSEEEAAAARAGVTEARLANPVQNREPKNGFEVSNQKVTEEERQAAQKVSDMTTAARENDSPTPAESAQNDAARTAETNHNSDIATAIAEGFKASKETNFRFQPDTGVNPRFTVVKNKQTGEVMLRENETGHLSKIQLESIEEKEASVQNQEVEEL